MVERRCRSRPLTHTSLSSNEESTAGKVGANARADQPRPPRRPAQQAGPGATRARPLAPPGRTPARDGLGGGAAAAPRRRCCTGTEHHTAASVSRRGRHCTEQAQNRHLRGRIQDRWTKLHRRRESSGGARDLRESGRSRRLRESAPGTPPDRQRAAAAPAPVTPLGLGCRPSTGLSLTAARRF